MKYNLISFFSLFCLSFAACNAENTDTTTPEAPPEAANLGDLSAVIETTKGTITLQLHPQETPLTVASFVNLAQRGYYDGLTFHRVIANFMIQGGDPTGTGAGGPGYQFADEFVANLKHDKAGILSMANAGPRTNGSQFFITHGPTPHLDNKHTVFGVVTEGMDVVNAIQGGDTMNSITIKGNPGPLMESQKEQVAQWNATLDENYPNLKPAGE